MAFPDQNTLKNQDAEKHCFPALVDHEPYDTMQEPMLLFKPPTINTKRRKSDGQAERKRSVKKVYGFLKLKKKPEPVQETLNRTHSFDDLHRRLRGWDHVAKDEVEVPKKSRPETYVYRRPRRMSRKSSQTDTQHENEPVVKTITNGVSATEDNTRHNHVPKLKSNSKVPVKTPLKKTVSEPPKDRSCLSEFDVMAPSSSKSKGFSIMSSTVGILRVQLLYIRIPQEQCTQKYEGNSDLEDEVAISEATSSSVDGLFCTLDLDGKLSHHESSLQPLKLWAGAQVVSFDNTEREVVFYSTKHQQLFIKCYKLPLKLHQDESHSTFLSQNPSAECLGVGVHTLAQQEPQKTTNEEEVVSDWSAVAADTEDINIPLEPHGSILLRMSYILLLPYSNVTCNGTVTIKGLSGINCFRDGEPCWTCCTVDIDGENFGTTLSVLGTDEFLNKGFLNDPIEFTVSGSCLCRIQVWGLGNDETEYCLGDAYIPLAAIFPHSKSVVHHEGEEMSLQLLEKVEREITMPNEPAGLITIIFNMYPSTEHDEPTTNETTPMPEILKASNIEKIDENISTKPNCSQISPEESSCSDQSALTTPTLPSSSQNSIEKKAGDLQ